MGCESCHGPGSLHVKSGGGPRQSVNPKEVARGLFSNVTSNVRAQFQSCPDRTSGAGRKNELRDCHNPHKGMAIKGGGTSMHQSVKGGGVAFMSALMTTCFPPNVIRRSQAGHLSFEHEQSARVASYCHSPHGSVNQRMLNNATTRLCLNPRAISRSSAFARKIFVEIVDHTTFPLRKDTCWSAVATRHRTPLK